MSESQIAGEGLWRAWHARIALPDAPLSRFRNELVAIALLVPVLMLPAFVNGFPIIFYDSGAYILGGFAVAAFIARLLPLARELVPFTHAPSGRMEEKS